MEILFDPSAPEGGDYYHDGALITNLEKFVASALCHNYGEVTILVMSVNDWFDPDFSFEELL